VGVFPETHFEQESVQLQQGDKLFIYSDGAEHIVGSCGKDGEFVYSEDFRSIMGLPVDEMMQAFDLIARNGRSAQPIIDDITAIALEIN
jgi:serine phosphatase RsbU (regulator of sigma subunit)